MGLPLILAFTAGLVAIVNPCGFALLPAYLSYSAEIERESEQDLAGHDVHGDRPGSAWPTRSLRCRAACRSSCPR